MNETTPKGVVFCCCDPADRSAQQLVIFCGRSIWLPHKFLVKSGYKIQDQLLYLLSHILYVNDPIHIMKVLTKINLEYKEISCIFVKTKQKQYEKSNHTPISCCLIDKLFNSLSDNKLRKNLYL